MAHLGCRRAEAGQEECMIFDALDSLPISHSLGGGGNMREQSIRRKSPLLKKSPILCRCASQHYSKTFAKMDD